MFDLNVILITNTGRKMYIRGSPESWVNQVLHFDDHDETVVEAKEVTEVTCQNQKDQ